MSNSILNIAEHVGSSQISQLCSLHGFIFSWSPQLSRVLHLTPSMPQEASSSLFPAAFRLESPGLMKKHS